MKFTKKEFYVLDSNELDTLIREKLAKHVLNEKLAKYESVAYEEWNNYSNYTFNGITKEQIKEDCLYLKFDKQDILEGELNNLRAILLFLVEHNEIPEGDYLISVYW